MRVILFASGFRTSEARRTLASEKYYSYSTVAVEMKKDFRLRKHNAEEISEKIRTEGGINEAVRQIIRITGEPNA